MTRMVLIDAAYGFADAISEIREIRGRSLPADNLPVHTFGVVAWPAVAIWYNGCS